MFHALYIHVCNPLCRRRLRMACSSSHFGIGCTFICFRAVCRWTLAMDVHVALTHSLQVRVPAQSGGRPDVVQQVSLDARPPARLRGAPGGGRPAQRAARASAHHVDSVSSRSRIAPTPTRSHWPSFLQSHSSTRITCALMSVTIL